MNETIRNLTSDLEPDSERPSERQIRVLTELANGQLPEDYIDFLRATGGAEGFVKEGGYLALWPIGEILQALDDFSIPKKAPWLLPIGSNGSSSAFAFDITVEPGRCRIVEVPYLDIGRRRMERLRGDSFEGFLRSFVEYEDD